MPAKGKIEVEIDNLDQLKEALDQGVDVVLLDNMSLERLAKAIAIVDARAMTEASGRVTPRRRRRSPRPASI
jgi:nicotinate-nucleotide pyrophosphorylase (carboxylating)